MSNNQVINSPLPQDLTIEILLRVEWKSTFVCKCVSKEWKNLINDPNFINLYRNKSPPLFLCKNKLYCVSSTRHDNEESEITRYRPSYKLRRISFLTLDKEHRHELIGSSNRIACLACIRPTSREFVLYDLLTGDSYAVSAVPDVGDQPHYLWICYGFGYDPYAHDYKIVVCQSFHRAWYPWFFDEKENTYEFSVVFVYSFENRCWKSTTGCFPCAAYVSYNRRRAYSFNGALHWVLNKEGDQERRVIGALNLHTYRWVETVLPTALDHKYIWNVGELDGKLCSCVKKPTTFEVWVMKEYGVGESWTKLLSFNDSQIDWHVNWVRPIEVYQCGDSRKLVLLVVSPCSKMELFWYDINNDKIEEVVDEKLRAWGERV